ncbi:finger putative transcription factor family-related [Holotrichia oblita]|uniref:Finger putative transcription factor family-related n=1 Tax=Holotrichia oblita TaxID=644536 RepID=A0ACB9TX12_HOLOL|nr:finger putative transcription factor family-related [Holotrichia oblita]
MPTLTEDEKPKLGNAAVSCVVCQEECSSTNALLAHQGIDHVVTITDAQSENQCYICKKVYLSPYYLKGHMREHEEDGIKVEPSTCEYCCEIHTVDQPCVCQYCVQKLYFVLTLTIFRKDEDIDRNQQIPLNPEWSSNEDTNLEASDDCDKPLWFCFHNECRQFFDSEDLYALHKMQIHGQEDESNKNSNQITNPECLQMRHHEKDNTPSKHHICEYCGKRFARKAVFRIHMKIHTVTNQFKCNHCQRRFLRRSNLVRHERIHTGENRFYPCDICKKVYTQYYLKEHIRQHDNDIAIAKPYCCKDCGRSFAYRSVLKNHQRTHTGEKPYKCGYCEQTFSHTSTLKRHERTHTGEKPNVCEYCGKGFRQKTHLIRHKMTHTREKQFVCSICKEKFAHMSHLLEHKRNHAADPRSYKYLCEYCNRGYALRASLRRHYKTCSGKNKT